MSSSKRLKRVYPLAVVFLTSMGVMIVELAASRLVSKYFGTSLYTWTTVIGVILGGISLGNYVGGKLADRYPPKDLASVLLLVSSILVFLVLLLDPVLAAILRASGSSSLTGGMVARAVLAITLLFFLPSAALGSVTPAIAKLVLLNASGVGNAVGKVYAFGALGSIVGTFLSGYVLIPLLGVRSIVLVVGGVVGALSILMGKARIPAAVWLGVMLVLFLLLSIGADGLDTLYARYSPYSYIEVRDKTEGERRERVLVMDGLIHNRYDPSDPDDLLYEYERIFAAITKEYAAARRGPISTLTMGGGAFLFPQYLERHFPGNHEVVEIDQEVVRTARRFFDLPMDTSVHIDVADARTFVNWAQGRRSYDIAYLDAFNSYSVPGHLTTREFLRSLKGLLSDDGLLICNLIDVFSIGRFLGAFMITARSEFAEVAVYERPGTACDVRNTFVVVCARRPGLRSTLAWPEAKSIVAARVSESDLIELQVRTHSVELTDDHAPVESFMAPVFLRSVR